MNKYTFRFQIGFLDTEIKEGLTMREAKDYALYRAKISGDGKCFVHGYNEKLFKWEHLFDMYEEGYFINSFGDRCWYKQPQSEHDDVESF